ncbi:hypothetical protein K474DRAFT_59962 [Panus rudis PR-1116 ss-1]|nr:hypothetical protein K474DRAFT_59962 [Panus rudis PR-1116 ss-1]
MSTLGLDELLIVMSYLRGMDIVRMMCTCRTLHEHGIPIHLGSPIILGRDQTQAFAAYVLRDVSKYGPMLRSINFSHIPRSTAQWPTATGYNSFNADEALSKIVKNSPNLRILRLNPDFDYITDCPKLMHSLIALRALEHITLCINSILRFPLLVSVLQSAPWYLKHLQLRGVSDSRDDENRIAIFLMLFRFTLTLESLMVTILPISRLVDHASPRKLAFPRLKALDVTMLEYHHYIPTRAMVELFPALQILSITQQGIVREESGCRIILSEDWRSRGIGERITSIETAHCRLHTTSIEGRYGPYCKLL